MARRPLDQLLVDRGLAESGEQARRLIRAGLVRVADQPADKPGHVYADDARIELVGPACPYVSRGGLKLEPALDRFAPGTLVGRTALDIGASTGGFTDCLLQRGVDHVWAVDSGRGQLHERLRTDPRVTAREQANARELTPEWLGGRQVDLIVCDVSFISLRSILPPAAGVLRPCGLALPMVKPQFEARRGQVGRGGVVRDVATVRSVLAAFGKWAREEGWRVLGVEPSPLAGPAGNREFFFGLERGGTAAAAGPALENEIERALASVYTEKSE